MTIASLPMYWRAENADLWRAFWSVLQDCAQAEGIKLPDLTPPEDLPTDWYAHWLSPDLALSMTCGLPFRTALAGKVQYIGTLDFGLGGPPGHYHSQILTRADLSSPPQKLAFNSADSQSGWAATQDIPNRAALTSYVATGGHSASLAAVAEARADIACLDAVTWRILQEVDPNAVKVLPAGTTRPTPGLPLITANGTDPTALRRALTRAVAAYSPSDPNRMGGPMTFCVLDVQNYLKQPIPAPPPA